MWMFRELSESSRQKYVIASNHQVKPGKNGDDMIANGT
jgi:hypothetical protein